MSDPHRDFSLLDDELGSVFLQEVLESPEHRAAVKSILRDPDHEHFAVVWQLATAYAYGLPSGLGKRALEPPRPS